MSQAERRKERNVSIDDRNRKREETQTKKQERETTDRKKPLHAQEWVLDEVSKFLLMRLKVLMHVVEFLLGKSSKGVQMN